MADTEDPVRPWVSKTRVTLLKAIRDRMRELEGDPDVLRAHQEADEGLRVALMTVAGNNEIGHLLAEIDAAYQQVRKWHG